MLRLGLYVLVICVVIVIVQSLDVDRLRSRMRRDNNKHQQKQWGYRNEDRSLLPKNWHQNHAKCYGVKQSPINVESKATTFNSTLAQITVKKAGIDGNNDDAKDDEEKWNIKNNGHSIVLDSVKHRFSFVMSPENAEYKLLQMHFHWRGSEHYIDGHKFAAELHLVHQNVNDETKFAVLGFLLSLSNKDNDGLKPIVDDLKNVLKYNGNDTVSELKLEKLIPFAIKNYYRYSGSLTTPDCDEVVEWFVIDNPVLEISEDQLLDFQSVEDKDGYPILTNVRPVQDVNERNVKRSFESLAKISNPRRFFISASGHTENVAVSVRPQIASYFFIATSFLIATIVSN